MRVPTTETSRRTSRAAAWRERRKRIRPRERSPSAPSESRSWSVESYRLTGVTATRRIHRLAVLQAYPRRQRCRSSKPRNWCPAVIVPRSSRRRSWCPPATPKGADLMHPGARTSVGPPLRFLSSGLPPRLGFGAWAVGGTGWGAGSGDADRLAAVSRALERGVTVFDTAPTYGDGASDALLGRVLRPQRERVAIATKVGPRDDSRASLEASLRRLQTEYVDLVQLHEATDRWEWRLDDPHRPPPQGQALPTRLGNAPHPPPPPPLGPRPPAP